jgi:glycosyltransferase involved in cell wall biosynthesis
MLKLSVITVVYNDVTNIEKTIKSVLEQNYSLLEYIIIDGGSTDGTCEIIDKYYQLSAISYYESLKDDGIYDAMNKGILRACGDYVCFMNSGDIFASVNVLSEVCSSLVAKQEPDFLYGDTIVITEKGMKYISARDFSYITNGLPFCHQSVFIKSSLHKRILYDQRYKYAADFDFFAKLSHFSCSYFYLANFAVSIVIEGGAADVGRLITAREYMRIASRHFKFPRWGQIVLLVRVYASKIIEAIKWP